MSEPETPARQPSRTALGVAAHRAAHQLFDGEPKILDDPIAARLLGADGLASLEARAARARDLGLRAHLLLRGRYAEERLERAVQRGVRQCVILGAGYDSFAYRQPAWARALRIFEVDQPATQADKRRRLEAAGIAIPDNLEFVAIDFERTSLAGGLSASTLDFMRPTFFSCLGVLVYLTIDAISAIFQLVAGFLDGQRDHRSASRAPSIRGFSQVVASSAADAAAGEPWLSALDAPAMRRELTARGFSTIAFLSPAEEAERLFHAAAKPMACRARRPALESATALVGPAEV